MKPVQNWTGFFVRENVGIKGRYLSYTNLNQNGKDIRHSQNQIGH